MPIPNIGDAEVDITLSCHVALPRTIGLSQPRIIVLRSIGYYRGAVLICLDDVYCINVVGKESAVLSDPF
jgi:hypothetical protein